ncbi:MAG: response regulator transcription factor [Anaerolineae bacterium]|nr:response regulator transcription factor [Anaerolineae bacterium]
MPPPVRVLLADDHPIVRSGLRHELDQAGDLLVVAEMSRVCAILDRVRQEGPDVAVLGVEFPDGNGIEACRQIKASCPQTAVLIFTAFDQDTYLAQAWAAGAAGYLVKGVDLDVVIEAIRRVARGEQTYTPEQLRRIRAWQERVEKPLQSLTARETEVLKLMADALTNTEIAERLHVSLKTVETHVQQVRRKLGLESRRDAIAWASHIRSLQP